MADNPNIRRTYATFRVWGPNLSAEDVTRRLGLEPSESHNPGDPRGTRGSWPHGYWALVSALSSTDLAVHIAWLLDHIEPVSEEIRLLLNEGLQADIFCFLESVTGHGGPTFPPTLLRRIATMNVALELDVYYAD